MYTSFRKRSRSPFYWYIMKTLVIIPVSKENIKMRLTLACLLLIAICMTMAARGYKGNMEKDKKYVGTAIAAYNLARYVRWRRVRWGRWGEKRGKVLLGCYITKNLDIYTGARGMESPPPFLTFCLHIYFQ